jgi:hypothetical protein
VTLGPWLIWYPALALINLLVFVAIRGRWGRSMILLGLASLAGVAAGDRIGEATGLELVRIGDMHVVAASVTAQLFMVAVTLLSALGPMRSDESG